MPRRTCSQAPLFYCPINVSLPRLLLPSSVACVPHDEGFPCLAQCATRPARHAWTARSSRVCHAPLGTSLTTSTRRARTAGASQGRFVRERTRLCVRTGTPDCTSFFVLCVACTALMWDVKCETTNKQTLFTTVRLCATSVLLWWAWKNVCACVCVLDRRSNTSTTQTITVRKPEPCARITRHRHHRRHPRTHPRTPTLPPLRRCHHHHPHRHPRPHHPHHPRHRMTASWLYPPAFWSPW